MAEGDTIVVGVDGSPAAERAVAWAAARCRETGGDLVAVHVLTYSKELVADLPPTGLWNWRRTLSHKLHGEWTADARAAGVPVRAVIVEHDSIVDGLLDVAVREHAGLLVVGRHRNGNIGDRLLGSTTDRVAHRATMPVVIVPREWAPQRVGAGCP